MVLSESSRRKEFIFYSPEASYMSGGRRIGAPPPPWYGPDLLKICYDSAIGNGAAAAISNAVAAAYSAAVAACPGIPPSVYAFISRAAWLRASEMIEFA